MAIFALLLLIFIVKFFPDAPISRFVNSAFVVPLAKLRTWQVATLPILLLIIIAASYAAMPIEMALLAAGDVSFYLELVAAIIATRFSLNIWRTWTIFKYRFKQIFVNTVKKYKNRNRKKRFNYQKTNITKIDDDLPDLAFL